MIDWLYQSTLDISILILLILVLRNPVRRMLGAHISYWLWSLPLLRLLISNKFERPQVITNYLKVPESNDLIPVYTGPIQASETQIETIVIIWLLGFAVWCLIKIIHGFKFKALLLKHSKTVPNNGMISTTLLQKFNPKVQIRLSSAVAGPLITGLLKPTIYLPQDFSKVYDSKQRDHIIEHELTHARRLDLWAQLVGEIFKAVFWFNPLVHLAWVKFQQDQELACDHQVLKNADLQTRVEYGETLKIGLSALLTPNSLTFFNHKYERFVMLTKHKNKGVINLTGFIALILIAYVNLSETHVSFEAKNIELHGQIISYNFKNIPLETVAMLVSEAAGGVSNFSRLNLLEGIMVTAQADQVYAFDFLDTLMQNNGLKVDRQTDTWHFSKL